MSSYDSNTAALDGSDELVIIQKGNAFSNKVTKILSAPSADGDLREALRILDEREVRNTPATRRRLQLDIQREVIDCNGDIVKDFGQVADQLQRVGLQIESLNATFEDIKKHIQAANREAGPMLEEVSTLLEQKREAETRKKLFDAFQDHFILSESEVQKLVSPSDGVDDGFFELLARLKRVHSDCQVLLGTEDSQLGLELMEQSSRTLNSAFQKLYRWIEGQFKTLELENPHMSAPVRRALRTLAERPTIFENCLETLAVAREKNLSDAFYSALTGTSTQTSDPTAKPMEFYAHDALRFTGDMLAWVHSAAVSEREALEVLFVAEGDEMAKGLKAGAESEPWLRDGVQAFDAKKALAMLVNRDLAGVARALRQRVERVIQADDEPVLAYKLANLIDFYTTTLGRLLGSSSSNSTMIETLGGLKESALRQYRSTMQEYISSILVDTSRPPSDLGPPEFLMDALAQLEELMKSFDTSLPAQMTNGDADDPSSGGGALFEPVMAECLDPVFAICEQMSKRLDPNARAMFTINCITATKLVLTPYRFTAARVARMDATVADLVAQLIEFQHGFFLQSSGLQPLVSALASLFSQHDQPPHRAKKSQKASKDDNDSDGSDSDASESGSTSASDSDEEENLRSIPTLAPFHPQALSDASQVLDDFLPTALDARENIEALRSKKLAEEITAEAAARFIADFEAVEARLVACDELYMRDRAARRGRGKGKVGEGVDGGKDEQVEEGERANEYVPLRSRYPRTSAEIRVLLS